MLHTIRYCLLGLMRNKAHLGWILIFPILLGIAFKVGLSNLNTADSFTSIPVAVVSDESEFATNFVTTASKMTYEDTTFLEITECSSDEAMMLLEEQKVVGIIYATDTLKLTISSDMKNNTVAQSILSTFVSEYNRKSSAIAEILVENPQDMNAILDELEQTHTFLKEEDLSYSDTTVYIQYYYNLIAMACLFTSLSGVYIALYNQGNMSPLAARKNISPMHRSISLIGSFIAYILAEFVMIFVAYLFICFILGVPELLIRFPFAVLAIFVSTLCGTSMGFFLGSFGSFSEDLKIGLCFAISMPLCFCSGLMVGMMRILIEQHLPWFNRINPAALISDSFYSIAVYEKMDRYFLNLGTLLLLSALFLFGGYLLTRRKKYANL